MKHLLFCLFFLSMVVIFCGCKSNDTVPVIKIPDLPAGCANENALSEVEEKIQEMAIAELEKHCGEGYFRSLSWRIREEPNRWVISFRSTKITVVPPGEGTVVGHRVRIYKDDNRVEYMQIVH